MVVRVLEADSRPESFAIGLKGQKMTEQPTYFGVLQTADDKALSLVDAGDGTIQAMNPATGKVERYTFRNGLLVETSNQDIAGVAAEPEKDFCP